ncbi:hypothetical protein [Ferrimonas balearica]|uniref:hypothetical protein n=1 Tax=Ferrimonas balearica TaxID=44012 RepID=UPI001C99506C|nr:hypothetical protein [Ferrimonas balearica]MBY5993209.1 hypothetical protein [Ferrimonas balearica]
MRTTLLLITLLSGGVHAAGFGCNDKSDQLDRLACYDQLAEAIAQCAAKGDKLDRLICFDEFTQAAGRALPPQANAPVTVAPAAPAAPVAAAPAPKADMEQDFGKQEAPAKAIDAIEAAVTKVTTNAYGQWTVTLSNGQRWRQTESKRYKLKSGDTVVIERASMGSFLLHKTGFGHSTRVKRVD